MVTATVEKHRWTREEYERMAETGGFGERRVELVEGVVYEMTPQNSPHATGIRMAVKAFRSVFPDGFDVSSQLPLALGADSMPEPDVSVLAGEPLDFLEAHPTSAVLVLEVVDSSEQHDRRKAAVYARAGIPEYWITNLVRDQVEVYRAPEGGAYRTHLILRRGERIAPLARPDSPVSADDLLPRRD
jgi:Uma2 family endonuclease